MEKRLIALALSMLICLGFATGTAFAQVPQKPFFTIHLDAEPRRQRPAEVFAQGIEEIGINVEVHIGEWQSISARVRAGLDDTYEEGGWDMWFDGTTPPLTHPHATLTYPESYVRTLDFVDRRLEDGIYEAAMETDPAKAKEMYTQIQKDFLELFPYIPVYYDQYAAVFNSEVKNTDAWAKWYITTIGDRNGIYCRSTYDPSGGVYAPDTDTYVHSEPNRIPTGLSLFGFAWTESRFLRLVRLDPGPPIDIKPELAESWNWSNNGKDLTFYLKPDISWSDGVTLTADEVKWTFDTMMDPKVASWTYKDLTTWIESIEAPDDTTVIFHLKDPNPVILQYFAGMYAWHVAPGHVLKDIPPEDLRESEYHTKPWTAPVTGWMKVKEEVVGEYTLFERNEMLNTKYFNPVKNKYYLFRVVPDAETALIATEKGEIHEPSLYYEYQKKYPEVANNPDLIVENVTSLTCSVLRINPKNPILQNVWVRKAIALATPVEKFINEFNYGFDTFTSIPVYPTSPYTDNSLKSQYYNYDIDKAKEYMEKAGYKYEYLTEEEFSYLWIAASLVGGLVIGGVISGVVFKYRKK